MIQEITVSTKGGLLAAIECHRHSKYSTRITLKRKSGTTNYCFKALTKKVFGTHHNETTGQWISRSAYVPDVDRSNRIE